MARLLNTTLKTSGGTVLDGSTCGYNVASQRTTQGRTDASTVTYTYDNIGELQSAVGSRGLSTENLGYKYDAAFNLNNLVNSREGCSKWLLFFTRLLLFWSISLLAVGCRPSADLNYLSSNMVPTILPGQVVKVYPRLFGAMPKRFELVVLELPNSEKTMTILRVVGLPGDSVSIKDGKVSINNEFVEYPSGEVKDLPPHTLAAQQYPPGKVCIVPDRCFFLLGDNSETAVDSRSLGAFDIGQIGGFVATPVSKLSK